MKAITLVPTEQLVGVDDDGTPSYRVEKAGYLIDHPDCHWLVRNGVAEPADEECEDACRHFWNKTSKKYLQAYYDQACCAHTTGLAMYDSITGEPEALERMKSRLKSHGIKFMANDPPDVMKKHLKLTKQLKVEANERFTREAKSKMQPKIQRPGDPGGSDNDKDADGSGS